MSTGTPVEKSQKQSHRNSTPPINPTKSSKTILRTQPSVPSKTILMRPPSIPSKKTSKMSPKQIGPPRTTTVPPNRTEEDLEDQS
ncbi:unnamed protein product [Lasius platythorax]|uniref:Uncharacterized protein n=1 Tax=Lasius platythorax TaxID=488582 RepID=A0AAV2N0U2_9HYME